MHMITWTVNFGLKKIIYLPTLTDTFTNHLLMTLLFTLERTRNEEHSVTFLIDCLEFTVELVLYDSSHVQ